MEFPKTIEDFQFLRSEGKTVIYAETKSDNDMVSGDWGYYSNRQGKTVWRKIVTIEKANEFYERPKGYLGGFSIGTFNSSTGDYDTSSRRVRTDDFINAIDQDYIFENPDGFEYMLFKYHENNDFDGFVTWSTEKNAVLSGYKYRLVFRNLDSVAITSDEFDLISSLKIKPKKEEHEENEEDEKPTEESEVIMKNIRPKVKSISHQGYRDGYLGNTIPAFIAAGERGFDGLETDIRFTLDSVPIIAHDSELVFLDGTTLRIAQTNYDDLMSHQYYEDESLKIPTFYDYIKVCKLYGMKPYVEIKGLNSTEEISGIVEYTERMSVGKCVWSSLAKHNLDRVLSADGDANIAYQATSSQQNKDFVLDGDGRWLYDRLEEKPNSETIFRIRDNVVSEDLINEFLDLGFEISLATVNDINQFEYAYLVKYILSDYYTVVKALEL